MRTTTTSLGRRIVAVLGVLLGCHSVQAGPFTPGNLIVGSQTPGRSDQRITEYRLDGTVVQTLVAPLPPASSDPYNPRDLVVGDDGRLHVYNGTFDPFLSTYDPVGDAWSHTTHSGWNTINNTSYGGIARFGNQVFVTDMKISGDATSGVVVFDTASGTSTSFASGLNATDLTRGLDGKLWVLAGDTAHAYDPTTFAPLGSVSVTAASSDVRGIAVDSNGDFFVANLDGTVARLSSSGGLLDKIDLGFGVQNIDVDVFATGLVAIGSRLDGAWLTDRQFSTPLRFDADRWTSRVAFVVPEPTSLVLLGLGWLTLIFCIHRPPGPI